MYKLNSLGDSVTRINTGGSITSIPKNTKDYQEYLKWLDKGNTPEPADPIPKPTAEQIYEAKVTAKEKTILRRQAVAELEMEAAPVATK